MTAVADDGRESFFTETVENWHPLIARFAADVTTGLELFTVMFTDQSSGEVWDTRMRNGEWRTLKGEARRGRIPLNRQSPIDNQETPVA